MSAFETTAGKRLTGDLGLCCNGDLEGDGCRLLFGDEASPTATAGDLTNDGDSDDGDDDDVAKPTPFSALRSFSALLLLLPTDMFKDDGVVGCAPASRNGLLYLGAGEAL